MLGVERVSEASCVLSLGFALYRDSDGEENQKAKLSPPPTQVLERTPFVVFKMSMD